MIAYLIKKLKSELWLYGSLLIGCILSVAMASTISINTSALCDYGLKKELESMQNSSAAYPGGLTLHADFNYRFEPDQKGAGYNALRAKVADPLPKMLNLGVKDRYSMMTFGPFNFSSENRDERKVRQNLLEIKALSGIKQHIRVVSGHSFSSPAASTDGTLEALVTEEAMHDSQLNMDSVYFYAGSGDKKASPIKVKIIGVFTYKDPSDIYWDKGLEQFKSCLLVNYDTASRMLENDWSPSLSTAQWYYALDCSKISTSNISRILDGYDRTKAIGRKYPGVLEVSSVLPELLKKYTEKAKQIRVSLLVLNMPLLIMLLVYILMLSAEMLERDRNEIALLQSRGAGSIQIFLSYMVQSSFLSGFSLLTGPVAGLFLCKLLGVSNGFLEFVGRKGFQFSLSREAYLFAAGASLWMILTMMLPIIPACRVTILKHKQSMAQIQSKPFWQKAFLDILLLGIASYGIYMFYCRQKAVLAANIKDTNVQIDPLFFLCSILFITGGGLLLIRLLPSLIKLVFKAGEKIWSPVLYASFIQVARSGGKEQYIMLFLIITISCSIFNAGTARTVNLNMEDKVRYENGGDIVVHANWETNKFPDHIQVIGPRPETIDGYPLYYREPDFGIYRAISGIQSAARVFKAKDATVLSGKSSYKNVNLIAVDPYDFANTAWFRRGLLSTHINHYLNLMMDSPAAILVSKSLMNKAGFKTGENISITCGEQKRTINGIIFETIGDYWPSFNPYSGGTQEKADFIIANLDFVYSSIDKTPYEVWLKKKPGISDQEINRQLEQKAKEDKLSISKITYTGQEIAARKREPLIISINGSATINFMISSLICLIGFLIYWIISIKKRLLYFSVVRALGLKKKSIFRMLALEQALVTGTSIFFGIFLGVAASRIFVPFMQMVYGSAQKVPPFRVVSYAADMIKILFVLSVMVFSGLVILHKILMRMKIDQVIKLGEE
ncbi:MAG: ABC transporter permease [Clostridia bacterium]|nr:ABC transporter permease [Clostridia bacterium]